MLSLGDSQSNFVVRRPTNQSTSPPPDVLQSRGGGANPQAYSRRHQRVFSAKGPFRPDTARAGPSRRHQALPAQRMSLSNQQDESTRDLAY